MVFVFWIVFLLFVVLSIAMTAVILLQEPKQSGLGGLDGGGGGDMTMMRGGTAGGLDRLTIWLGTIWGLLALFLTVLPRA